MKKIMPFFLSILMAGIFIYSNTGNARVTKATSCEQVCQLNAQHCCADGKCYTQCPATPPPPSAFKAAPSGEAPSGQGVTEEDKEKLRTLLINRYQDSLRAQIDGIIDEMVKRAETEGLDFNNLELASPPLEVTPRRFTAGTTEAPNCTGCKAACYDTGITKVSVCVCPNRRNCTPDCSGQADPCK